MLAITALIFRLLIMITLQSPSKINLFLRILKKRSDGYHEIASAMQAISLMDTIHFALSDVDDLACSDPSIPTDGTNLIFKAAEIFRRKTRREFGLKVFLEKRIPHQAGLGGGSGNAATTLWALNQLCGCPVRELDLANWSSEIGSDIPFFFSSGSAYCTGRGELITHLNPLPSIPMCIVKPLEGLSTPEVYRNLNVSELVMRDPEISLESITSGEYDFFNDLEIPAFRLLPSLAALRNNLIEAGFDQVIMSGSGSAFFCCGKMPQNGVPDRFCIPVQFLSRKEGEWYTSSN